MNDNLPPRPDVEELLELAKQVDEVCKRPEPPLPNMATQHDREQILSNFTAERLDTFARFLSKSGYKTVSALCQYILALEARLKHFSNENDEEAAVEVCESVDEWPHDFENDDDWPALILAAKLGIAHGRVLERKAIVSWLQKHAEYAYQMSNSCPLPLKDSLRKEIQHNGDAFHDAADRIENGDHSTDILNCASEGLEDGHEK